MIEEALDLTKIRQTLEKEQASLEQRVGTQDNSNGRQQIRNLDRADLAQSYTQQERNSILAKRELEQLAQIETALQKLDDGRYGLCEDCGQAIVPGRLKIIPYATLCIECQSNSI